MDFNEKKNFKSEDPTLGTIGSHHQIFSIERSIPAVKSTEGIFMWWKWFFLFFYPLRLVSHAFLLVIINSNLIFYLKSISLNFINKKSEQYCVVSFTYAHYLPSSKFITQQKCFVYYLISIIIIIIIIFRQKTWKANKKLSITSIISPIYNNIIIWILCFL